MARIRTIKPETASDRKLASTSRDARYTFVLLITQADDDGFVLGETRQLLGALFPHDQDVDAPQLEAWIGELVTIDIVHQRSTRDGAAVLELVNWKNHQRIDKPSPSKIRPLLVPFAEPSRTPRESPARVQRIEAEREVDLGRGVRSGVVDLPLTGTPSTIAVDNSTAPPADAGSRNSHDNGNTNSAPHAKDAATATVRRFLHKFYAEPGKRRVDVVTQLEAALCDFGAKLDRATRVRAVDAEHLDSACQSVISQPPRDRDKAIVFVLKKLQDTRLEVMSARHRATEPKRSAPAGSGAPVHIGDAIAAVAS